MIKIAIRQFKIRELARVRYITKLAYKIPYKEETLVTKPHEPKDEESKIKNKEEFIVVALVGDKIVGAVRYNFNKFNNLYFFKLAVLKSYRKRGVGFLLILEMEKIAKKKGCKKVLLDCAQEKRLDEYYKKFGFIIDKVEEKINHHAVYMSKNV
jgi:GNAT superfamily N-acetyltransferase